MNEPVVPLWPTCKRTLARTLAGYGLSVVQVTDAEIRFESGVVWATLYRDPIYSCLSLRFSLLRPDSPFSPMSVADAVRLENRASAALWLDPPARDEGELRSALEHLGDLITQHCGPALLGDQSTFAAMAGARQREIELYGRWTREAAESGFAEAVAAGNWARLVEIYQRAEHAFDAIVMWDYAVARQNLRTLEWGAVGLRDDDELARSLKAAYDAYDYGDGGFTARQRLEFAVADAFDRQDWSAVIDLYESAAELDRPQRERLAIARAQHAQT